MNRQAALRSFATDPLSAMTAVLDGSGVIVDTNAAWRLSTQSDVGLTRFASLGVAYLEACDRAAANGTPGAAAAASGLRQVLAGDRESFDLEYPSPSPADHRWFRLRAAAEPGAGGGLVLFHADVTASRQHADRAHRAGHDELTGLADRRLAVRFAEERLAEARAGGPSVWVLCLDLDGFREVNDRHGQQAGDSVLVEVASRAQSALREGDLLSRFSGDEFVAVCPGMGQPATGSLAARWRALMSKPFRCGTGEVRIGASVGFAVGGGDGTVDRLLSAAGDGMRLDKRRAHERRGGTGPRPAGAPARLLRSDARPGEDADLLEKLQASQARADAIVARSKDLVMFFSADGTIEWASPACRELFGVRPERLVGLNGYEMIHAEDRERALADLASITGLGDHVCTEFRVTTRTGDVRWVEEIATNLLDEPSVGVIVANLRDITARKRAEEAVRFQARLLAAVGQPIIAMDTGGTVIYWNDAATVTYGWTATEAMGQRLAEILRPAAGWEPRGKLVASRLRGGHPWSGEWLVQGKSGPPVPVMVIDTPVFDADGAHVATIGVSSDISERLQSRETAARLSAIVDSSSDAIFSANQDSIITTWNGGAAELFGVTDVEIIGKHVTDVPTEIPVGDIRRFYERVLQGHKTRNAVVLFGCADGREVHVSVSISPIRDASGVITGTCTIARNVTDRVELQQRLEEDRRQLADAQASARLGSFEFDPDTGRTSMSDELCRILGREPGRAYDFGLGHVPQEDRQRCRQLFMGAVAGGGDVEHTHRIVRPNGEVRWVVTRLRLVHGPRSRVIAGTMLDVTERHDAEQALAHQARHDPLTQLLNRNSLDAALREALSSAGHGRRVALAFLDIDQFKSVNDSVGHPGGDQVLCVVADRLRRGLPGTDVLARTGGDEFVLLRSEVATLTAAHALAAEAAAVLVDPVTIDGGTFELTASVGVTLSDESDSPDSLLRDADDAMYQSKEDGRARITVFDEKARARAQRRQHLTAALGQALAKDELRLEYQPIFGLEGLEVAGFESLLRWDHPTLGSIPPDEFIPIAETSGLIVAIGAWVLDTSLAQLATWRADPRARPSTWMAVNVSVAQLGQAGFVRRVAASIEQSGLPPELVHLEITESVLMDRVDKAMATIVGLRALGLRISIDDFGAGHSSLSYLNRLPLDTLKIDRSFVEGLGSTGPDTSIVRAIIGLARTLGLDVVAEGIETPAQLELLRGLGCTYGQGWLWSRSVRPPEALAWLVAYGERGCPPPDVLS